MLIQAFPGLCEARTIANLEMVWYNASVSRLQVLADAVESLVERHKEGKITDKKLALLLEESWDWYKDVRNPNE